MREKERYEIEVHVAGICLRINNGYEVLIAKRSPKRELFPNLWECGGGQVYPGCNFEEAVKKQLKEELNVEVEVVAPIATYEIITDLPQKKIPGIYFLCKFLGGEPKVDGEELIEFRWQPVEKLGEIELIPGLHQKIKEAVKILKSMIK